MAKPPFIAAKHFTRAHRERVDWLVIHTTESPLREGQARRTAARFAGDSQEAPQASAHYVIDPGEVIQCVCEADVAWHAPGANRRGIGIELTAYVGQDWGDPLAVKLLERAAELCARITERWGIPVERVWRGDLLANRRGICGHIDVTEAFGKSTHRDPGPTFAWGAFIELIRSKRERLA